MRAVVRAELERPHGVGRRGRARSVVVGVVSVVVAAARRRRGGRRRRSGGRGRTAVVVGAVVVAGSRFGGGRSRRGRRNGARRPRGGGRRRGGRRRHGRRADGRNVRQRQLNRGSSAARAVVREHDCQRTAGDQEERRDAPAIGTIGQRRLFAVTRRRIWVSSPTGRRNEERRRLVAATQLLEQRAPVGRPACGSFARAAAREAASRVGASARASATDRGRSSRCMRTSSIAFRRHERKGAGEHPEQDHAERVDVARGPGRQPAACSGEM